MKYCLTNKLMQYIFGYKKEEGMEEKKYIIFTANKPLCALYIERARLDPTKCIFADKWVVAKYNHTNSVYILSDGYIVNPAYSTLDYSKARYEAKKAGVEDFIRKEEKK